MDKLEFKEARKKLGKTQKKLAELLGMSLKTIHSYEQGWRTIPNHIERQIYFLLIHQRNQNKVHTACWEKKQCNVKEDCPAWEFQAGHLCWYMCGTLCECTSTSDRKSKLDTCRECDIFKGLLT